MPSGRQEQFARQMNELLKESRNASVETARRVAAMLEDVRKDIIARIATAKPESFTHAQLESLLAEINRQLDHFATRAGQEVEFAQQRQYVRGAELEDKPIAQITSPPLLAGLDRRRLVLATGYPATLVTNLADEVRGKLNGELRRAMLGGQPITDVIDRISGLLGGATKRAEDIAFTEINRMQSAGTQSRLEQMAGAVGDVGGDQIKKEWRHNGIGVPRPGHVRLHGTAVPVNEPFTVEEYANANGQVVDAEKLMYPRDPAGSPRNTINCHCTVVPHVEVPEWRAGPRHGRLILSEEALVAA